MFGYGHTFPEAYTSWDRGLKDSVSHQRLLKYHFGGIRCLLRFESDGYLEEKAISGNNQPQAQINSSDSSKDTDVSVLLTKAESIFVSEKAPTKGTNLTIEFAGREIPQSAIFDLKTRSARKEINMEEIYPRLWLSQIPNFIIAYHSSGKFDDIRPQELLPELEDWETKNQQRLGRLYTTLHQLIDMARNLRGYKLEVRRTGVGPLEIRKLAERSWSALPHDLKDKWAGLPDTDDSAVASEKETGINPDEDEDEERKEDDYLNFWSITRRSCLTDPQSPFPTPAAWESLQHKTSCNRQLMVWPMADVVNNGWMRRAYEIGAEGIENWSGGYSLWVSEFWNASSAAIPREMSQSWICQRLSMIYIYIIYTPNLGFEIAVLDQKRKQGRYRGSSEGAVREQGGALKEHGGALREQEGLLPILPVLTSTFHLSDNDTFVRVSLLSIAYVSFTFVWRFPSPDITLVL